MTQTCRSVRPHPRAMSDAAGEEHLTLSQPKRAITHFIPKASRGRKDGSKRYGVNISNDIVITESLAAPCSIGRVPLISPSEPGQPRLPA